MFEAEESEVEERRDCVRDVELHHGVEVFEEGGVGVDGWSYDLGLFLFEECWVLHVKLRFLLCHNKFFWRHVYFRLLVLLERRDWFD